MRRKRLARRAGCRYLWGLNADPLVTVLGKPELAEGANALSAFAANWIGLPKWKRTPKKGMTLGCTHTGGATLPKRRGASRKWFDAMSCQDGRPGSFGSGEVGLR